MRILLLAAALAFSLVAADSAEAQRIPSPRGESSTQIGADFDKWIVVDYGRPLLRGRTGYFGLGNGDAILSGADVWRVGANVSTRISTEVNLMFGDQMLAAGEYSMFVEMGAESWTLIFSDHKAKSTPRGDEEGIWGGYGYSTDKDVLRTPMMLQEIGVGMDQFTISFFGITSEGGRLALIWEDTMAGVQFSTAANLAN